ncbi:hypothetical protein ACH47Z_05725 [Streptomyces sp. NPDC020192]|uniref:hypothetical protein n=1 Tax=Streptomyces sp. NPDC020192 TaxID=3365066 RepID=UPI0037A1BB5B
MTSQSWLQVWTTPIWLLLMVGPLVYLIAQIGEQIDHLRFMPPKSEANKRTWRS